MMERAGNFADMVTGKKEHETTGKTGTGRKTAVHRKIPTIFIREGDIMIKRTFTIP